MPRSRPDVKYLPRPPIIATRASGVSSTQRKARRMSSHMARFMALALSGRFRSIVATPSARATLRVSKFGFMFDSSVLRAKHLLDVRVEHCGACQVLTTVADDNAAGDIRSQGRGEKGGRLADVIHGAHAAQRYAVEKRRLLRRI